MFHFPQYCLLIISYIIFLLAFFFLNVDHALTLTSFFLPSSLRLFIYSLLLFILQVMFVAFHFIIAQLCFQKVVSLADLFPDLKVAWTAIMFFVVFSSWPNLTNYALKVLLCLFDVSLPLVNCSLASERVMTAIKFHLRIYGSHAVEVHNVI